MEVQSKWSLIFSGHLGPEIEVVFLMKGQVLQHLREHRKVPGWRSEDRDPFTKELRKLLSRLNETSRGSLKISGVRVGLEQFESTKPTENGGFPIEHPKTQPTQPGWSQQNTT